MYEIFKKLNFFFRDLNNPHKFFLPPGLHLQVSLKKKKKKSLSEN